MNVLQSERPNVKGDPDLIPKKDAVVDDDSCPGWNLVAEERLKIADQSHALMGVENGHLIPRQVDISDFETMYAALRQAFLDALADWQGRFLARSERIQAHLETVGVSEETLEAAVNEGQAIIRHLAAAGRCGR
jgi:hypothetical protein